MAETGRSDAGLARALAALGRDIAYPPTPPLAGAVTSRLLGEAAPGARPRIAWSRRRILVAAALALLALLALAAAARFVLGAAEVRVQPGVTEGSPPQPIDPAGIGTPVALSEARAAVGFEIELPPGPEPDQAYLFRSIVGAGGVLLAWEPDDRLPPLPGTPWGLVLIQVQSDADVLLKTTQAAEDVRIVRVDGRRAFWIEAPHVLDVLTDDGYERFSVRGGVLIWTSGGVTHRLESALGLDAALDLAESIG